MATALVMALAMAMVIVCRMSEWYPTNELRFVKRSEAFGSYARLLQQKWMRTTTNCNGVVIGQEEEWRDVPEVSDE